MDEEIVDIVILPTGEVEVKVTNVKGPTCTEVTKTLEKALGGKVKRTLTKEYGEKVQAESKKKTTT